MKVERATGSYQTYVIFDAAELLMQHKARYYAVPEEYRDDRAAEAAQPSQFPKLDPGIEHPDMEAYTQNLEMLDAVYWKIVADIAERNQAEQENRDANM